MRAGTPSRVAYTRYNHTPLDGLTLVDVDRLTMPIECNYSVTVIDDDRSAIAAAITHVCDDARSRGKGPGARGPSRWSNLSLYMRTQFARQWHASIN